MKVAAVIGAQAHAKESDFSAAGIGKLCIRSVVFIEAIVTTVFRSGFKHHFLEEN